MRDRTFIKIYKKVTALTLSFCLGFSSLIASAPFSETKAGTSTLGVQPAAVRPAVKRQIAAKYYRKARPLFPSDAYSPYNNFLDSVKRDIYVLPSGNYLVKPEALEDDLSLVRMTAFADFTVLLNLLLNEGPPALTDLEKKITSNEELMLYHETLFPYDKGTKKTNRHIFVDLLSKALELHFVLEEQSLSLPEEISAQEKLFYRTISPLIEELRKNGQLPEYFFGSPLRERMILSALDPGYKVRSEKKIQQETKPSLQTETSKKSTEKPIRESKSSLPLHERTILKTVKQGFDPGKIPWIKNMELGQASLIRYSEPKRRKSFFGDKYQLLNVSSLAAAKTHKYLSDNRNPFLRGVAGENARHTQKALLEDLPFMDGRIALGDDEGIYWSPEAIQNLSTGDTLRTGTGEVQAIVDVIEKTDGIFNKKMLDSMSIAAYVKGELGLQEQMRLYMRKIIVGEKAAGSGIDVSESIDVNLERIANSLGKDIKDLKGSILLRPCHYGMIETICRLQGKEAPDFSLLEKEVREKGAVRYGNLYLLNDGDIISTLGLFTPETHENHIDFVVGRGGYQEGMISAAITKAMGGKMSAQLASYDALNPESDNDLEDYFELHKTPSEHFSKQELRNMNIGDPLKVRDEQDLIPSDDIVVTGTAIKDNLWIPELKGLTIKKNGTLHTSSLWLDSSGELIVCDLPYRTRISEIIEQKKHTSEKANIIRLNFELASLYMALGNNLLPEAKKILKQTADLIREHGAFEKELESLTDIASALNILRNKPYTGENLVTAEDLFNRALSELDRTSSAHDSLYFLSGMLSGYITTAGLDDLDLKSRQYRRAIAQSRLSEAHSSGVAHKYIGPYKYVYNTPIDSNYYDNSENLISILLPYYPDPGMTVDEKDRQLRSWIDSVKKDMARLPDGYQHEIIVCLNKHMPDSINLVLRALRETLGQGEKITILTTEELEHLSSSDRKRNTKISALDAMILEVKERHRKLTKLYDSDFNHYIHTSDADIEFRLNDDNGAPKKHSNVFANIERLRFSEEKDEYPLKAVSSTPVARPYTFKDFLENPWRTIVGYISNCRRFLNYGEMAEVEQLYGGGTTIRLEDWPADGIHEFGYDDCFLGCALGINKDQQGFNYKKAVSTNHLSEMYYYEPDTLRGFKKRYIRDKKEEQTLSELFRDLYGKDIFYQYAHERQKSHEKGLIKQIREKHGFFSPVRMALRVQWLLKMVWEQKAQRPEEIASSSPAVSTETRTHKFPQEEDIEHLMDYMIKTRQNIVENAEKTLYKDQMASILTKIYQSRIDKASGLSNSEKIDFFINSSKSPHWLVLKGEAGSGKTSTLISTIKDLTEKERFTPIVVDAESSTYKHPDLALNADRILKIAQHLIEKGQIPVVIYDNVEQAVATGNKRIQKDILELTKKHIKVITSVRSLEYEMLLRKKEMLIPREEIDLHKLTEKELLAFCQTFLEHKYEHIFSMRIMEELKKNRSFMALARTPLVLRMIFDLYRPSEIPEELSFLRIFQEYWESFVAGTKKPGPEASSILLNSLYTSQPVSNTYISRKREEAVLAIAFEMLSKGQPYISNIEFDRIIKSVVGKESSFPQEHIEHFQKNLKQSILSSGILTQTSGDRFVFFNNLFYEYAAAKALLKDADNEEWPLEKRINSILNREKEYVRFPVLDDLLQITDDKALVEKTLKKMLFSDNSLYKTLAMNAFLNNPFHEDLPELQQQIISHLLNDPTLRKALIRETRALPSLLKDRSLNVGQLYWQRLEKEGLQASTEQQSFMCSLLEALGGNSPEGHKILAQILRDNLSDKKLKPSAGTSPYFLGHKILNTLESRSSLEHDTFFIDPLIFQLLFAANNKQSEKLFEDILTYLEGIQASPEDVLTELRKAAKIKNPLITAGIVLFLSHHIPGQDFIMSDPRTVPFMKELIEEETILSLILGDSRNLKLFINGCYLRSHFFPAETMHLLWGLHQSSAEAFSGQEQVFQTDKELLLELLHIGTDTDRKDAQEHVVKLLLSKQTDLSELLLLLVSQRHPGILASEKIFARIKQVLESDLPGSEETAAALQNMDKFLLTSGPFPQLSEKVSVRLLEINRELLTAPSHALRKMAVNSLGCMANSSKSLESFNILSRISKSEDSLSITALRKLKFFVTRYPEETMKTLEHLIYSENVPIKKIVAGLLTSYCSSNFEQKEYAAFTERALNALEKLSTDKEETVRTSAILSISSFMPDATERVLRTITALKSEKFLSAFNRWSFNTRNGDFIISSRKTGELINHVRDPMMRDDLMLAIGKTFEYLNSEMKVSKLNMATPFLNNMIDLHPEELLEFLMQKLSDGPLFKDSPSLELNDVLRNFTKSHPGKTYSAVSSLVGSSERFKPNLDITNILLPLFEAPVDSFFSEDALKRLVFEIIEKSDAATIVSMINVCSENPACFSKKDKMKMAKQLSSNPDEKVRRKTLSILELLYADYSEETLKLAFNIMSTEKAYNFKDPVSSKEFSVANTSYRNILSKMNVLAPAMVRNFFDKLLKSDNIWHRNFCRVNGDILLEANNALLSQREQSIALSSPLNLGTFMPGERERAGKSDALPSHKYPHNISPDSNKLISLFSKARSGKTWRDKYGSLMMFLDQIKDEKYPDSILDLLEYCRQKNISLNYRTSGAIFDKLADMNATVNILGQPVVLTSRIKENVFTAYDPDEGTKKVIMLFSPQEMDIIFNLDHRNIVTPENYDPLTNAAVYPYKDGWMPIYNAIYYNLSLKELTELFGQILLTIEFLHKNKQIHGDIIHINALVSPDWKNVLLLDAGMWEENENLNVRNDIFELGALLYRFLSKKIILKDAVDEEYKRLDFVPAPINDFIEKALGVHKPSFSSISEMIENFNGIKKHVESADTLDPTPRFPEIYDTESLVKAILHKPRSYEDYLLTFSAIKDYIESVKEPSMIEQAIQLLSEKGLGEPLNASVCKLLLDKALSLGTWFTIDGKEFSVIRNLARVTYLAQDRKGKKFILKISPLKEYNYINKLNRLGRKDIEKSVTRDMTTGITVYEYIQGKNFSEILESLPSSPQNLEKIIEMLLAMGWTAKEVSDMGIHQNDLDYRNIIFPDDGEHKVIDFEVSTPSNEKNQSLLVYGMGSTMYFVLTGMVFSRLMNFVEEKPSFPGGSTHYEKIEYIPDELNDIIRRALGKSEYGDEYPSIKELLRDLEEVLVKLRIERTAAEKAQNIDSLLDLNKTLGNFPQGSERDAQMKILHRPKDASEKKVEKVGIYTGTFNPLHNGHVLIAEQSLETLGLDEMLLTVNSRYGRTLRSSGILHEDHALMLKLFVENEKDFSLGICNHYSYLAKILAAKKVYGENAEYFMIMGADNIESLFDPDFIKEGTVGDMLEKLFGNSSLAVVARGDLGQEEVERLFIENGFEKYLNKIRFLDIETPDLSSHQINQNLYNGISSEGLVPATVSSFIQETGLFGPPVAPEEQINPMKKYSIRKKLLSVIFILNEQNHDLSNWDLTDMIKLVSENNLSGASLRSLLSLIMDYSDWQEKTDSEITDMDATRKKEISNHEEALMKITAFFDEKYRSEVVRTPAAPDLEIESSLRKAFSHLEKKAKEALFVQNPLSGLSGISQRPYDAAKLRLCIPAEVIRNSADLSLALNRISRLRRRVNQESVEFHLMITGAEKKDRKLLDLLNKRNIRSQLGLPENLTVTFIGAEMIQQQAALLNMDSGSPLDMAEIVKRLSLELEPLNPNEYMAITVNSPEGLSKGTLSSEIVSRLEKNISVQFLTSPEDGKAIYSISGIINSWLQELYSGRTSFVNFIPPAQITSEEMRKDLENAIIAIWTSLQSA